MHIFTNYSYYSLFSKKHKPVPVNRLLYSCFFLVTFFLTYFFSIQPSSAAKTSLEKGEEQVRVHINKLESSIDNHKESIKEQENEEIFLLQELENIDQKIQVTQQKLDNLLQEIDNQEGLIKKKKLDLEAVNTTKNKAKEHLQNRMNAYYTTGNVGFLNVAFSTKSLPELLSFQENFNALITYDKNQIQIYRERIRDLERSQQALALEKEILNNFVNEVNSEKEILSDAKQDKQRLINRIRTQRTLHTQAIKEMELAAKHLTKNLVVIKKKKDLQNNKFLRHKGYLLPPVPGEIITRFLEEKENALGVIRKSMGIALQVPDGTPVVATEDGEVTYAGYMKGYGNTVIIHHGYQYYTVTSRIEKITIKKGQKVRTGNKIGITGNTATLLEDGLYFEIRHGKKSQDPLMWLDPTQIKVGHF